MIYYCNSSLQLQPEQALYFISISITTIGFGDIVPKSPQDKWFTMIFVTVGFVEVYAVITGAMESHIKTVAARIQKKKQTTETTKLPKDDMDVEAALRRKKFFFIALLVGLHLLGAGLGMFLQKWNFTVGYVSRRLKRIIYHYCSLSTDLFFTCAGLFVLGIPNDINCGIWRPGAYLERLAIICIRIRSVVCWRSRDISCSMVRS
jgi:F0F1-type ATP synthase membrane subunit c/vacuolar-type H+-ATPase subunit K